MEKVFTYVQNTVNINIGNKWLNDTTPIFVMTCHIKGMGWVRLVKAHDYFAPVTNAAVSLLPQKIR